MSLLQPPPQSYFYMFATNIKALVVACDEVLYAFVIDLRCQSIYPLLDDIQHLFIAFEPLPPKYSFDVWNKWKSLGAKSGQYGEWPVQVLCASSLYFLDDLSTILNKSENKCLQSISIFLNKHVSYTRLTKVVSAL